MYDEDLETDEMDSSVPSGPASTEETPFQNADTDEVVESPQAASSEDAPQPNAAREEATPDPEFKNETVVKDYKSWQRINQEVAEFTGKPIDEVKAMPFEQRMELLATERKALTDKLSSLSEYENFIGLKVDKPAETWDPRTQLNEFPENHLNKLVDVVMKDHLPKIVDEAIANPQSHPEEFQLLDGVLTRMLETSVGRGSQEIAAILQLTQGIAPQQLYQLLQGNRQATDSTTGFQSANAQPAQQVSQAALLMQEANTARAQAQAFVNAGYEADSPEVVAWLNQERSSRYGAQMATERENEYQALQKRIAGIESQFAEKSQTEAQQTAQQIDSDYDSKAAAARNGALEEVLKGRVSEDDKDVRELVEARAERSLKENPKAQQALADAKAWHKDKAEAKARGEMAKYLAAVSLAYTESASFVLNKFVVPKHSALRTADKQKAARKEIGLNGQAKPGGTTQPNVPRVTRDEDVGDAVWSYYQSNQGAQ